MRRNDPQEGSSDNYEGFCQTISHIFTEVKIVVAVERMFTLLWFYKVGVTLFSNVCWHVLDPF